MRWNSRSKASGHSATALHRRRRLPTGGPHPALTPSKTVSESMSRAAVRRVVTGHNDEGRAVILFDGPSPQHFESEAIPGFGATVPWMTRSSEIDHVTDDDAAGAKAEIPTFPASGQTFLRIAEFPPDTVYPTNAGNAIFTEIDGHDEAEAGADSSGGKHFGFHRTDSLDHAVVLEG